VSKYNLKIITDAEAALLKSLWLRAHRGVLSQVALQLQVTPQAVRKVYHGKGTSRRIRLALLRRGAPIGKAIGHGKKAA
jgi:hypothetical protein